MNETIEEMEKRHLREKAELIDSCSHEKLDDWLVHYYAPAHNSRYKVKLCKHCGAIRQYSGGEVGEKYEDAMIRLNRIRWMSTKKTIGVVGEE